MFHCSTAAGLDAVPELGKRNPPLADQQEQEEVAFHTFAFFRYIIDICENAGAFILQQN